MSKTSSKRYSAADLSEFKAVIERKLDKAEKQLIYLDTQLAEISAKKEDQSDWVDDSSNSANLQLLNTMAIRLRKHIVNLKNALRRIHNKTYGVCAITGKLIDKKRLLAVPITTKSLAAKIADKPSNKKKKYQPDVLSEKNPKKVVSRVIRKHKSNIKESEFLLDKILNEDDHLLDDVENIDFNEEIEDS